MAGEQPKAELATGAWGGKGGSVIAAGACSCVYPHTFSSAIPRMETEPRAGFNRARARAPPAPAAAGATPALPHPRQLRKQRPQLQRRAGWAARPLGVPQEASLAPWVGAGLQGRQEGRLLAPGQGAGPPAAAGGQAPARGGRPGLLGRQLRLPGPGGQAGWLPAAAPSPPRSSRPPPAPAACAGGWCGSGSRVCPQACAPRATAGAQAEAGVGEGGGACEVRGGALEEGQGHTAWHFPGVHTAPHLTHSLTHAHTHTPPPPHTPVCSSLPWGCLGRAAHPAAAPAPHAAAQRPAARAAGPAAAAAATRAAAAAS